MANIFAWALFALGVAHVAFGLVRFKKPLTAAVSAGFIDRFSQPEDRRTAFWFLIFGPPVMLAGQVAVHAVATGDVWLLRVIGWYVFAIAVAGIAAFPKSPFWGALVVAPALIAAGYGWL